MASSTAVRLTEDGKIIKRGKRTYPDGSIYEVSTRAYTIVAIIIRLNQYMLNANLLPTCVRML
jgi:hypothetical protein